MASSSQSLPLAQPDRVGRGYLIALAATAIWSSTAVLIRYLTETYSMPPLVLAFWRDFMVAGGLTVALLLVAPQLLRVPQRHWPFLLLYGFVLATFNALWTVAVALDGAAVGTVLVYSSPGFCALIGWRLFGDRLTKAKLGAIALSLVGCVLVSNAYRPEAWHLNPVGVAAGLLGGAVFACYSIMGQVAARRRVNSWTALLYTFLTAAMFLLLFHRLSGWLPGAAAPASMLWLGNSILGWAILLALALGPTLGGYGLYGVSLGYLPAGAANLVATLEPSMTAVQAYLLLGERLTGLQMLGMLLVIGAVVALRLASRPRYSPHAVSTSEENLLMNQATVMAPRERFLAALRHEMPDRVPIFDWTHNRELYERQTGIRPAAFDGRLIVRLNQSLGLDAAWVPAGGFPGLLGGYEPVSWSEERAFSDEWGIGYRVSPDAWPLAFAIENPVRTAADWPSLPRPDPRAAWRLGYAEDARCEAEAAAPCEEIAVVAGIRGPFSTALMWMGFEALSYALFEQPQMVDDMFAAAAEFWTEVGLSLVRSGAVDALVIHEDMGSNGGTLLSPRHMRRFALPHLRREADALIAAGVPVILHSCGNINALLPDLMGMGFAGLNNLQRAAQMDLAAIKSQFGERICLIGNVDATNVLPTASEAEVEAAVIDCLRIAAPGGGHILASDHSLHDGIPLRNIDAFIAAGRRHGAYPLHLPEYASGGAK